ncbi:MAG: PDZ domain-containing protein [Akkermansia sp.]|nr:PDZ domain-containing protein [Akkermansia sp.]
MFLFASVGKQGASADNEGRSAYFGVIPLKVQSTDTVGSNGAGVVVAVESQHSVVNGAPAPLLPARGMLTVLAVVENSPAERAGLQSGDCIVRVGEYPVSNAAELRAAIAHYGPGSEVEVRWLRQGVPCAMQILLTRRPTDLDKQFAVFNVNALSPLKEQTIELSQDADSRIRRYKERIWAQLQLLPRGEMHVQSVINDLQAMRDIAATCHVQQPGWMAGRACEATLEFSDAQGKIILRGVDNILTLTVVDSEGRAYFHTTLKTPEVQRAIPSCIRSRLLRNGADKCCSVK